MKFKFRNAMPQKLFGVLLCTGGIICLVVVGLILSFAFNDTNGMVKTLIIFLIVLLVVWTIFLFVTFVFHKTVEVTEDQIVLKKAKKVVWLIKKEDILECFYSRIFDNGKYYPEAGYLYFKLKKTNTYARRKICKGLFSAGNYIGVSFKNIKKMIELGYTIKITNKLPDY